MNANNDNRAALIQRFTQDRYALEGYILAIVRDPHLAADVYQDVAVVVLAQLEQFDTNRDFRAWVCGIARNKAKQALSKTTKVQCVPNERLAELIDQAYAEQTDETWIGLSRYGHHLNVCLLKLTATVRRILDLRYGQDLSLRDVAKVLGKSEGSIRTALSRTREVLHQCIERELRLSKGEPEGVP